MYELSKSSRKDKKMMVKTPAGKIIHFGARGFSDFTKHKDESRKARYIARHRQRENWDDKNSAGFWALNILWNKPDIAASIRDTERRHKIKIKIIKGR